MMNLANQSLHASHINRPGWALARHS